MLNKLLYKISGLLPARAIFINGQPYMERYFLFRAFGYTAYLHRFLSADGDRYPHDHPWETSYGIPLTGGYSEERCSINPNAKYGQIIHGYSRRKGPINRLQTNKISHKDWHRIARVQPRTWTLFIHSTPRIQEWGFVKPVELATGGTAYQYSPHPTQTDPDWHQTAPRGHRLPQRQPLNA